MGRCGPLAFAAKDGGAQQQRRRRGAPLPPEADDNTESTIVVGWTLSGNFCHVPVIIHGAPRTALVDTGSTATLMRPDVVPAGTQLEQTTVQLRTVTGELAPMLSKGRVTLNVGGLSVDFTVWVAQVKDPCVLGLDCLPSAGPGEEHISRGPHC